MTAETHPIDKEKVMAYLDGELLPDEAARVAMHLDQCAACAELASELRAVSTRLLAWNVETAPKRMSDAVFQELNNREAGEVRARGQQKPPLTFAWLNFFRRHWMWTTAGAFAALLSVVAIAPRFFQLQRKAALSPGARLAMNDLQSTEFQRLEQFNQLRKPPASTPPVSLQSRSAVDSAMRERGLTNSVDKFEIQTPTAGPMVARTATLSVSAKDFDAARISMDRIVHAHQGYASSLNVSTEKGAPRSLNAKLAVPAAQFDATLGDLRALGRVGQEQQSSEEVTSQVVDLDARLKNARETEVQLAEILRTRTGKVGDILEVEQEMARVRGEIEVMDADQKHLRERVAFASIELNLAEEYQAQLGDAPSSVARPIRNALVDGYHAAADGLLGVCVFLLNVGPSLLVWGLILFWPARWAWRRWQKARVNGEASA